MRDLSTVSILSSNHNLGIDLSGIVLSWYLCSVCVFRRKRAELCSMYFLWFEVPLIISDALPLFSEFKLLRFIVFSVRVGFLLSCFLRQNDVHILLSYGFIHYWCQVMIFVFVMCLGPPKALDEDETEFLDKLETVSIA